MNRTCSVSAKRAYGKVRVCRLWGLSRSTHYARQRKSGCPLQAKRRGRRPVWSDEALAAEIRKVWPRPRSWGSGAKERIRRLMREQRLLAPHRPGKPQGPWVHDGTIIPGEPNRMWGMDATQVPTRTEGMATVFLAIDHFVGDMVGVRAARPGTRFETLESIYQGIREHFVLPRAKIADGLVLRHDHGPQYMSHHFQAEITFLGIESSPSFVRSPEGNGVAERFIRTLKEQLLWVQTFDTVEELCQALLDFKEQFNKHGILQRHRYATPNQVRAAHATVAETV